MRLLGKLCSLAVTFVLLAGIAATQVTPEEAATLKTTLTPMGAERAGNKEGTIPPWTGGYTDTKAIVPHQKRPDFFASEKPLFTVNSKNMAQYVDKLTDGVQAMLKKYPDSLYIEVYPSHRTAAYPQFLYDNTFKNATRAKEASGPQGIYAAGAVGGIPFPIPKNGSQVMFNTITAYRGVDVDTDVHHYTASADGKLVLIGNCYAVFDYPWYYPEMSAEKVKVIFQLRSLMYGPPIRAGEGVMASMGWDDEHSEAYTYLPGQRRTRKLPNQCCDTPTPMAAGLVMWDENAIWGNTHFERFDWKLLGKKEVLIPYNSNKTALPPKDTDVLLQHHMNPKWIRWELHRCWVVEATLKQGYRHAARRRLYYVDEDSWLPVMNDSWDSSGRLWRSNWAVVKLAPDIKCVENFQYVVHDLTSGVYVANFLSNESTRHLQAIPRMPASSWTSAALASSGVR